MRIELVRSGERGVVSRGHRVELHWTGAEVPALYRIYRDYYGPADAATKDVHMASANRQDLTENVDIHDARTIAYAHEDAGLDGIAEQIYSVVGRESCCGPVSRS